jgi:ArsR family transcriptional regulator
MRSNFGGSLTVLKALASATRLAILDDLKAPEANFPAQVDGDRREDGICADYIRARLDVAAATASRHLTLLVDAGLLVATRKRGWTFYRRDENAIDDALRQLRADLAQPS